MILYKASERLRRSLFISLAWALKESKERDQGREMRGVGYAESIGRLEFAGDEISFGGVQERHVRLFRDCVSFRGRKRRVDRIASDGSRGNASNHTE